MLFGSVRFYTWIIIQTIFVGTLATIAYAILGTIGLVGFSVSGIAIGTLAAAVILVIPIPKTYMYASLFAACACMLSVVPIVTATSGACILLLVLVCFVHFNWRIKPYGLEYGWRTPMWPEKEF